MLLATALKARMTHVTKECVWYCKLRRQQTFPKERLIVDVPRARFALLEAEREIVESGKLAFKEQPANADPALERLRNEAIMSIASQTALRQRETIPAANEADDDGSAQNMARISEMTKAREQPEVVTLEDVGAFVENDAFLSSSPLLRRNFENKKYKV